MRIRARCPSAQRIGVGFVRQRQLRFHKVGIDGTGKADAYWTGNSDDLVWGVIYRCSLDDRPTLDRCESLGIGYEEATIKVYLADRVVSTFLYQAKSDRIDPNLKPAKWYHQHVVTGAAEHSLPPEYQRMIESHYDPDDEGSALPPLRRNR